MTVTSTIISVSDPPFTDTGSPSWTMNGGDLSANDWIEYTCINKTFYISSIHISNYSSSDAGNYCITAINKCGYFSGSVYIGKSML